MVNESELISLSAAVYQGYQATQWGLTFQFLRVGRVVNRATSISGCYPVAVAKQKLLLDEPTSALDQLLEQQLLKVIFEQLSSATIIMVTHKMAHIEFVERIAVIDKGRMVMDGPKAEVMARLNGKSDKGVLSELVVV